MMPKIIQSWKHSFRLCWSFVSKQTLQRSLSRSRRTSALSMARPWKFVRITVAFWERKVILNEQWPFSAVSSSPRCFITEMMPDGVVSVLLFHFSQKFFKKNGFCLLTFLSYPSILIIERATQSAPKSKSGSSSDDLYFGKIYLTRYNIYVVALC